MIEFDIQKNSGIAPEKTEADLPKADDVKLFFECHFKKNVDQYMIFKKNQFKNPNKEFMNDFINKLESFVKQDNKDEVKHQSINLTFDIIKNSIKLLSESNSLPDNDKVKAFFVSFVLSKFFS
jgi:hypothetical protein